MISQADVSPSSNGVATPHADGVQLSQTESRGGSRKIVEVADHVMGKVTRFSCRTEVQDRVEPWGDQYLVRAKNWTVWDFCVELRDQHGNVLIVVPVHVRGVILVGAIRDGDDVRIDLPWQAGEILYASQLFNLTIDAWVGDPYTEETDEDVSYKTRWGVFITVIAVVTTILNLSAGIGISVAADQGALRNALSIAFVLSLFWFAFLGWTLFLELLKWLGIIRTDSTD